MKTKTDLHWNERASSVEDDVEVNIMDIFQRELEYDYICSHLKADMKVLEVGCGNGFSTQRFRPLVKSIDAFDYADKMIERAKVNIGEVNNRFFVDNVLSLSHITGLYDAVICVRVLINLQNYDEQRLALTNLIPLVKQEGIMIVVEGFLEGFASLSNIRNAVGLPPIKPADINYYSPFKDLESFMQPHFTIEDTFHLGAYDYLTRVAYPLIVGEENVKHNTVFSEKFSLLARAYNDKSFEQFSRIRGLVFRKR